MVIAATLTELRALLERSSLLAPQWLETGCKISDDPQIVWKYLLDERLLTPFQADQLKKGRADSFFLTGKYKVLDYIGAGGMGKVYLCEHLLLHRLVAVKLLHLPANTGPETARTYERFYREARAVAALNDPNIIRVFDVDSADGNPFMVQEYADGTNLHDIVTQHGPLSPERAAHYIRQAALGLQHAHEIGLVHRDIKPGNLILDRTGTIKLLDMGLARFNQDPARNQGITEKYDKHIVLGTVDFMSPEQAFDTALVDVRSDIYGLGCTLYYLLTGQVPFPDRSVPEKMYAHKTKAPAPVSEICPQVPFALLTTLERMMAKEPADRFQTPRDVVLALADYQADPGPPRDVEMPVHPASFYRLGLSPAPGVGPSDAVTPNPLAQLETDRTPKPGWVLPDSSTLKPSLRKPSTDAMPSLRVVQPSRRRRWLIRTGELAVFVVAAGVVGWLVSRKWHNDNPGPQPPASVAEHRNETQRSTPAAIIINGGGSTFINPVMQRWLTAYEKAHGVRIDYQANGSGKGIQGVRDRVYLFGCSDVVSTGEHWRATGDRRNDVVYIPLAMGAVAVAYNLPDVTARLNFSGPALADVYLGKITRWNDPALAVSNPGIHLPDLPIAVVRRVDASGTTYIWTDYLSKASADWNSKLGAQTEIKWPVGSDARGNNGVAAAVSRQVGAIGYMELSYALENNLAIGQVKNRDGQYVAPNPESVAAAAGELLSAIPADLRYGLTDAPGANSYPISGSAWAILHIDQRGRSAGKELVAFLRWATHEGQSFLREFKYAPLPPDLVKRIDDQLDAVTLK